MIQNPSLVQNNYDQLFFFSPQPIKIYTSCKQQRSFEKINITQFKNDTIKQIPIYNKNNQQELLMITLLKETQQIQNLIRYQSKLIAEKQQEFQNIVEKRQNEITSLENQNNKYKNDICLKETQIQIFSQKQQTLLQEMELNKKLQQECKNLI